MPPRPHRPLPAASSGPPMRGRLGPEHLVRRAVGRLGAVALVACLAVTSCGKGSGDETNGTDAGTGSTSVLTLAPTAAPTIATTTTLAPTTTLVAPPTVDA